ncbi:hypothetical protein R3P38DRAFT_2970499 [Favolaschia claudopus]|uniref:Uncharacterized protein n=1 Tax=Favolaschia claudopus TaxID=2862362 RepID=A0AAW0B397_9AGAR
MYALKLALLLAAATASYAYPVSSNNPDLPALLARKPETRFSGVIENPRAHKRQVRNADYQANNNAPSPTPTTTRDSSPPPPAPSEPTPKDKRADTALWRGSGVSSDSGSGAAGQRRSTTTDSSPWAHVADRRRQIHNADYQANNHPAQQSSPANAPAATPSSSPSKDKRTVFVERSPVVSSSSSPVEHDHSHTEKESHNRPAVDGKPVSKRAHLVDFGFGEGSWYGNRALKLEESHGRDCD